MCKNSNQEIFFVFLIVPITLQLPVSSSFLFFIFIFCQQTLCILEPPGSLTSLVLIVCPILFFMYPPFPAVSSPFASVTGAHSSQGRMLCFPLWFCCSAFGFADSFIVAPSSLLLQTTDLASGFQWLQVAVLPFFKECGAH